MIKQGFSFGAPVKATAYSVRPTSSGGLMVESFIVENGLSKSGKVSVDGKIHDPYRVDYLRDHFREILKAVNTDRVPLIGYTMWAPIDLISLSSREAEKRYGFVFVDLDNSGNGTYQRKKKDSFFWMKKVIASNGNDLE